MKKNSTIKMALVIMILLLFIICSYINYRSEYLQVLEIGEEYLNVFHQNMEYKNKLFIYNFIIIFLVIYITNILIKRGLKVFFKDEKKEIPKLPNKSIAFFIAIIISTIVTSVFLDKFILFLNSAWFGINDPVFNLDIGFYLFQKPMINLFILYDIFLFIFLTIYTVIYYITVFNLYLDGVDKEILLKSGFIKILKANIVLIVIGISTFVVFNTYNVLTDEFMSLKDALSTKIIGAGIVDISIKIWGYRILAAVMIVSSIFIVEYLFKKQNTKKILISISIVPIYLVILFIIMVIFNLVFVSTNKLDKEKDSINNNINNTQTAYKIKIEEELLNSSELKQSDLEENEDIINNINILNEELVLKNLNVLQTNSGYYSYRTTRLQLYKVNGEDTLLYISPREIYISSDSSIYNRTYEYTHGFGSVITYANQIDQTGNIEYLEKDFTSSNNGIYTVEPRIYYGLQTDNTVIVNSHNEQEFDYPVTTSKHENNYYKGKAGISIGFLDKLILSITNKDINIAFSNLEEGNKVLINRNIIKRAKKIMPFLQYDEDPYLIISDEGRQIWVLDAYTTSNEYPYSQKITTKVDNNNKDINYIRNSVKVLVDAYNGSIDFYITDKEDPIAIAYSNAYEGLFKDGDKIPTSISKHFIYPEYLYNIQSEILKIYHNVTEDVLYRGNDVWDVPKYSTSLKTTVKEEMDLYYTVIKYNNENKLGIVLPYTVYGKQNITAYLVGTTDEKGQNELKLYKFASGTNILGPEQLDKEIEQDEIIAKQLETINVTGTKITKNIIIVPMNNSLLYVEPIYQQQLNEKNAIPLLKKIVVSSGNKIAIGNNISEAIQNLLSQSAVNIKVEDDDKLENIINEIIEANKDLSDSSKQQNFELIGKDISKLQGLILQLEEEKKNINNKEETEIKNDLVNDIVQN